jgi:hypothetical protein
MALQLRPNCECCDRDLVPNDTEAMICSFECTFCRTCAQDILLNVCPNCGGGFTPRPIRPSMEHRKRVSLMQHPASEKRVLKPVDKEQHRVFADNVKDILPENR